MQLTSQGYRQTIFSTNVNQLNTRILFVKEQVTDEFHTPIQKPTFRIEVFETDDDGAAKRTLPYTVEEFDIYTQAISLYKKIIDTLTARVLQTNEPGTIIAEQVIEQVKRASTKRPR
jgi:hypothetical protein